MLGICLYAAVVLRPSYVTHAEIAPMARFTQLVILLATH